MDAAEAVAIYGSAWDETDEGARLAILEKCWAPDGVYCDPTANLTGREALSANIAGFQQAMAGHRIEPASGVDVHDDFFRFAWKMLGPQGNDLMEGVDFGRLDENGQIKLIVGFFGPWPEVA